MLSLTKQRYFYKQAYTFKQSVFVSLITLVSIAILIQLGCWQINRANEKTTKAKFIKIQQQKERLTIHSDNQSLLETDKLLYQKIKITGYFDGNTQFFLDNKKFQGRVGYEVITAFYLENSKHYLLINRGWVAMGKNRDEIPKIAIPDGQISLYGKIIKPQQKRYRPGINQPVDDSGNIWLYMDTEYFSQKTGNLVYPVILLLDKQSQYGFIRQWPKFQAKAEIHYAFAMQWFAFALFFVISYLYMGFKKSKDQHEK